VHLTEVGPDRVQVEGASGHPRPDQLKATLGYRDGFIGEGQISYAGPGARARGELALPCWSGACSAWAADAGASRRTDRRQRHARPRPGRGPRALRGAGATGRALRHPVLAEQVGQEVEALYLNGPAGGGGVTMSVREVVAVASALIPREAVVCECQILEL
jgi:hypothetical protein